MVEIIALGEQAMVCNPQFALNKISKRLEGGFMYDISTKILLSLTGKSLFLITQ